MKYIFLLILCASCASVTCKRYDQSPTVEEKLNKLTDDMIKLQREMEPRVRVNDYTPFPGG